MHQVARKETETRRQSLARDEELRAVGTTSSVRRLAEIRVRPAQVALYGTLVVMIALLLWTWLWSSLLFSEGSRPMPPRPDQVDSAPTSPAETASQPPSSQLPATGLGLRWDVGDERWQWQVHGADEVVFAADGTLRCHGGYMSSANQRVQRLAQALHVANGFSLQVRLQLNHTSGESLRRQSGAQPIIGLQQSNGQAVFLLQRLGDRLEIAVTSGDPSLPAQILLSDAGFFTPGFQDVIVTVSPSTIAIYKDGAEIIRQQRRGEFGDYMPAVLSVAGAATASERFAGILGRGVFFDYALSSVQIAQY
jgi:hypothetical protein